jgi:hypothetical protein
MGCASAEVALELKRSRSGWMLRALRPLYLLGFVVSSVIVLTFPREY